MYAYGWFTLPYGIVKPKQHCETIIFHLKKIFELWKKKKKKEYGAKNTGEEIMSENLSSLAKDTKLQI